MKIPYNRKTRIEFFCGGMFLLMCAIGSAWLVYFIMGANAYFLYPQVKLWQPVSCEITSSSVVLVRAKWPSKVSCFQIDVTYRYRFNGIDYLGTQYQFPGVTVKYGDHGKPFYTDYPVGKQTVCYVNPHNPAEAILDRSCREWFPAVLLFTSMPLFWLSLSFNPLRIAFRRRPTVLRLTFHYPEAAIAVSSIACMAFSLGLFLLAAASYADFYKSFAKISSVCGIFALLVGAFLLWGIRKYLYQFQAPRIRVFMEPGVAHYGEMLHFRWQVPRTTRWRELQLRLVCIRTLNSGKEEVPLESPVVTWRPMDYPEGEFRYQLPNTESDIPGWGTVTWAIEVNGSTRYLKKIRLRPTIVVYNSGEETK